MVEHAIREAERMITSIHPNLLEIKNVVRSVAEVYDCFTIFSEYIPHCRDLLIFVELERVDLGTLAKLALEVPRDSGS